MDFEALQQKHRKELRDLQATITSKKKSATKKTRRGILAECEALERDLKDRQARELAELDGPTDPTSDQEESESKPEAESESTPDLSNLSISEPKSQPTPPPQPQQQQQRKPNRQKARLARRAAETEAAIEKASLEAQSLPNLRESEQAALQAQFDKLGLREHDITPDGHCLYSAFSHQLSLLGELPQEGEKEGYKACREKAAEFIESHRGDFEPFLDFHGGDGNFEGYVRKVRDTAEWGGQLEVLALARAYGVVARIVQAEGRGIEVLNEDGDKDKEVWLAYYRHIYGLGEHYNSLVKVDKS